MLFKYHVHGVVVTADSYWQETAKTFLELIYMKVVCKLVKSKQEQPEAYCGRQRSVNT